MADLHQARTGHPDEDALVEVCLGHADPRTRENVAAHLARCPACRAAYDELAAAVEGVLPAVPHVAPPAGFENRVLAALDEQPQRASGAAERNHTARPVGKGGVAGVVERGAGPGVRRRTVLLGAAAGLLGVAAGAGVTAYLGRAPEPATDPWAVPLVTTDGAEVGTVTPGYDDRGQVLVVAVLGGEPGLAITCLLELTDGGVEDMGRWELSAERPNSWVVPLGGYDVARVDLIVDDHRVWASAVL